MIEENSYITKDECEEFMDSINESEPSREEIDRAKTLIDRHCSFVDNEGDQSRIH